MAKSQSASEPQSRTLKKCPNCGATVFQGPFVRGPIENGALVARDTLYQCVNCNRVAPLSDIPDFETETPLAT